MSPYSGFRVEDWSSLIPAGGCVGLERGCPPVPFFLCAWSQGEQDVQMEREQVSQGLACAVPRCWNVAAPCPQRANVTHRSHSVLWGQGMGQGGRLCAVSCIT